MLLRGRDATASGEVAIDCMGRLPLIVSFSSSLSYLCRHDAELERLTQLQEGRGKLADHYHQQHARKEDSMRLTIARERDQFETSGIGELV